MHSKTLFKGSIIFKNDLGRLNSLNNEDWSLFIEKKEAKLVVGGSTGWLAVRKSDRWASTGPQPVEVQSWPGSEGH